MAFVLKDIKEKRDWLAGAAEPVVFSLANPETRFSGSSHSLRGELMLTRPENTGCKIIILIC